MGFERPRVEKMISEKIIGLADSRLTNTFQNTLGISEGDLNYLRDNGLVNRCIVDDDAAWRLDEDGNWPEVD